MFSAIQDRLQHSFVRGEGGCSLLQRITSIPQTDKNSRTDKQKENQPFQFRFCSPFGKLMKTFFGGRAPSHLWYVPGANRWVRTPQGLRIDWPCRRWIFFQYKFVFTFYELGKRNHLIDEMIVSFTESVRYFSSSRGMDSIFLTTKCRYYYQLEKYWNL